MSPVNFSGFFSLFFRKQTDYQAMTGQLVLSTADITQLGKSLKEIQDQSASFDNQCPNLYTLKKFNRELSDREKFNPAIQSELARCGLAPTNLDEAAAGEIIAALQNFFETAGSEASTRPYSNNLKYLQRFERFKLADDDRYALTCELTAFFAEERNIDLMQSDEEYRAALNRLHQKLSPKFKKILSDAGFKTVNWYPAAYAKFKILALKEGLSSSTQTQPARAFAPRSPISKKSSPSPRHGFIQNLQLLLTQNHAMHEISQGDQDKWASFKTSATALAKFLQESIRRKPFNQMIKVPLSKSESIWLRQVKKEDRYQLFFYDGSNLTPSLIEDRETPSKLAEKITMQLAGGVSGSETESLQDELLKMVNPLTGMLP